MKHLLALLLITFPSLDPTEIAKVNELKNEAEEAYLAGNFEKSIEKYSYLVDTLNVEDESATMNLANAYYQLNQNDNAISNYQRLQDAKDESLKSLAYQQLGVLSNDPKTLEKGLSYFKEAIKSDPTNEDARYNYELLKKRLKEQQQNQDQNQDQQNEDKENKDQENKDQQDKQGDKNDQEKQQDGENQEQEDQEQQQNQEGKEGEESEEQKQQNQEKEEGEKSDEEKEQQQSGEQQEQQDDENKDSKKQPPSTSQKLQEMNISEDKAKMILEAMKASEIQYIQQNRRKATKRKDTDKPDW